MENARDLPEEMWAHVAAFCDWRSVVALRKVCADARNGAGRYLETHPMSASARRLSLLAERALRNAITQRQSTEFCSHVAADTQQWALRTLRDPLVRALLDDSQLNGMLYLATYRGRTRLAMHLLDHLGDRVRPESWTLRKHPPVKLADALKGLGVTWNRCWC